MTEHTVLKMIKVFNHAQDLPKIQHSHQLHDMNTINIDEVGGDAGVSREADDKAAFCHFSSFFQLFLHHNKEAHYLDLQQQVMT